MWISEIQSIVFTRVKTEATKRLKTKYPNIFFGTSDRVSKEPVFPSVYVKRMQGASRGQNFEIGEINAIISSFQIEVTDDISEKRTQEVADVIMDIMIDMGYDVIGEPFQDNSNDAYRNVARYRRTVGSNDILQ